MFAVTHHRRLRIAGREDVITVRLVLRSGILLSGLLRPPRLNRDVGLHRIEEKSLIVIVRFDHQLDRAVEAPALGRSGECGGNQNRADNRPLTLRAAQRLHTGRCIVEMAHPLARHVAFAVEGEQANTVARSSIR